MLGAAVAAVTANFRRRLRSQLIVFGLAAMAALLVLGGAGYGLDALHAFAMPTLGPIGASLAIAALLIAVAGICGLAAITLGRRPARRARRV